MSIHQEHVVDIPIECVERGFFQPREYFNPEAMAATLRSIEEKGQKYPVIVRMIKAGNPLFDPEWTQPHYELADGERRYRCCKELGFKALKAIIRDLSDEEMLDYTLTTNDSLPLNPIEKANVFSRLAKEFGKSQAEIAKSFNLKQQQVSEYIRLLELPKELQDLTARAVISVRHARELLKISDKDKMSQIALEVKEKSISTRQLTKIVKNESHIGKKHHKNETIYLEDIDFSSKTTSNLDENSKNDHDIHSEVLKTLVGASKIDVFQAPTGFDLGVSEEERRFVIQEPKKTWLDHLNFYLIPKRYYGQLEAWISFELGSTDSPEKWLSKVELSLIGGLCLSLLFFFLPQEAALASLAGLGTIVFFFLLH